MKNSGNIIAFSFLGQDFSSQPTTAFYDWLYINALWQNRDLSKKILGFKGFSDIVFNPSKSINCQAHAAALFSSLHETGKLESVIENVECYMNLITNNKLLSSDKNQASKQLELPF